MNYFGTCEQMYLGTPYKFFADEPALNPPECLANDSALNVQPSVFTMLIPRKYLMRCGAGMKTVLNPVSRGALARNIASGLFPLFGGVLMHPKM